MLLSAGLSSKFSGYVVGLWVCYSFLCAQGRLYECKAFYLYAGITAQSDPSQTPIPSLDTRMSQAFLKRRSKHVQASLHTATSLWFRSTLLTRAFSRPIDDNRLDPLHCRYRSIRSFQLEEDRFPTAVHRFEIFFAGEGGRLQTILKTARPSSGIISPIDEFDDHVCKRRTRSACCCRPLCWSAFCAGHAGLRRIKRRWMFRQESQPSAPRSVLLLHVYTSRCVFPALSPRGGTFRVSTTPIKRKCMEYQKKMHGMPRVDIPCIFVWSEFLNSSLHSGQCFFGTCARQKMHLRVLIPWTLIEIWCTFVYCGLGQGLTSDSLSYAAAQVSCWLWFINSLWESREESQLRCQVNALSCTCAQQVIRSSISCSWQLYSFQQSAVLISDNILSFSDRIIHQLS